MSDLFVFVGFPTRRLILKKQVKKHVKNLLGFIFCHSSMLTRTSSYLTSRAASKSRIGSAPAFALKYVNLYFGVDAITNRCCVERMRLC